MSDFPRTRHELMRAGYALKTPSAVCKGCTAPIEWWKTPNGKPIPMNPMASDHAPAAAHFTTCPHSQQFKGAAATPSARPLAKFELQERAVRELRERMDARVVVIVDSLGTYASWKDGIPAEDLRHDLISAGNFVRGEVSKKEGTPA